MQIDAAEAARRELQHTVLQWMGKRPRLGDADDGECDAPKRKRQRHKAYEAILSLHNALLPITRTGLACYGYEVLKDKSQSLWPSLEVCPGQGPDIHCGGNYIQYKLKLNCYFNYDFSHGAKNDIVLMIKHIGLWGYALLELAAHHVFHGPYNQQQRLPNERSGNQKRVA